MTNQTPSHEIDRRLEVLETGIAEDCTPSTSSFILSSCDRTPDQLRKTCAFFRLTVIPMRLIR